MDTRTSLFYKRYAEELTANSEAPRSAMLPHIERRFGVGTPVLDVGAGSGRDLAAMLALGLNALGVEPNPAMREKALSLHPSLRDRLRSAMLPALGRPFADRLPGGFDAVLCSAVLMHLNAAELTLALASLVEQLRPRDATEHAVTAPALLISFPLRDAARLENDRDEDGRRFYNHDPSQVRSHLAVLGMSLEQFTCNDAAAPGTGTSWCTLVFRRVR